MPAHADDADLAPEHLARMALEIFARDGGDALMRMRAALGAVLPRSARAGLPDAGPRWRHLKRGTRYTELGRASVQVATRPIEEGDVVVIYRGDDGVLAARRDGEFEDGRFERLPA